MAAQHGARRTSAFHEVGLDEGEGACLRPPRRERPQSVRFRSTDEVFTIERHEEETGEERLARLMNASRRPLGPNHSPLPDGSNSTMYRFGAFLLLLAGVFPLLQNLGFLSHGSVGIQGVRGGPIPEAAKLRSSPDLERRQDSPTDVCFRWAQQSAIVNGTLYLYGGQATTDPDQTQNTWNNNFLTLDLTTTWQIGTPTLKGLPQPSGPPEVALGYLFNDHESLYLYGGQFSWQPPVSPVPFATWEYNIPDESWVEHSDPLTSGGNSAPSDGEEVERSSEGAGVNIPTLGRGYYFGGHQDGYTTAGWSQSVWRIYLQSMLEYTFPGYPNSQVDSLGDGQTAGDDGVYRNITNGGLQADAGFTARADGILAYIPGFGDEGILLALAGGTNETFTQMNNVNVYDIAKSSWYTQATAGETPDIRVNPCAVVAASQDGTSYNVYMWGGQNLIPAGNQTQFDDMWILSVPSFNWIKVDQQGQSVPYGRSGHTCNIWNGQLVSVGGYLGDQQLTCESPGIYVFDLSKLEWVQQFTALSPGEDNGSDGGSSSGSSDKSGSSGSNNPFNQQPAQIATNDDPGGLYGSYGYEVPEAVYKVIGGGKTGGATITTPAATATAGPLATGKPQTYTVTRPDGSTITETSTPGAPSSANTSSGGDGGPNIAAIVVGTVCGILLIVIAYLLFCLYLYRKQLALYKNHVEMSQRQARGEKPPAIPGLWTTTTSDSAKSSSDRRRGAGAEGQPFLAAPGEANSQTGSNAQSGGPSSSGARRAGGQVADNQTGSSARSSTEDLLAGQEPTFVGVLLNPRRSLKVVNRD